MVSALNNVIVCVEKVIVCVEKENRNFETYHQNGNSIQFTKGVCMKPGIRHKKVINQISGFLR